MGSQLLDDTTTWAEFGKRHLDRRVTKALTQTLGLERPTLVQSRGIPVALEGKDLLCRARTGSGKTLCYAVPMVQRLLGEVETPMRGLILVPTKELIAQVHGVVSAVLSFCFDMLSVEPLISGKKYMKAELPSMLVTTPSSILALVKQRKGSMRPLSETLQCLVADEADLMFSFGYEDDMRALCALMPSTYQAILVSATLSEEVEQLKGLMLHKPVILKLEEPRVTGKLAQFYFVCHKQDKYLVLYTLLKLKLVSGKTLLFVKNVDEAYKLRIFLERFSINSAVLNGELPHASRQNIIQSFNQGLVELLIATDKGFQGGIVDEGSETKEPVATAEVEEEEENEQEEEEGEEEEEEEEHEEAEEAMVASKASKKKVTTKATAKTMQKLAVVRKDKAAGKKKKKAVAASETDEDEEGESEDDGEEAAPHVEVERVPMGGEQRRLGRRGKPVADEQFSLTRGVDLKGVSTVINADIPPTVRDYVHRVGRCARGGASGTALTLCAEEEEPTLEKIIRAQSAGAGAPKPLPLQISDAERFRYRVEDMARGLTKKAVAKYRARELQLEALNSEKLKAYFEENPEDRRALQQTQRTLRERKSVRANLRTIPSYLVPEDFAAATPVQQAVRDDASKSGTQPMSKLKRKRMQNARQRDPLQAFDAGGRKGKSRRLREQMEAIDRKIDPATANVDSLPPLSGKKLWKMRHRKPIKSKKQSVGGGLEGRKRLTMGMRSRQKKFGRD
eukprot:TRINITY_DN12537_c1_g1_i1.p1 TRINITY_DN12537_c1_g1~~TRINITY_DN12537_c1_g1_i1.p1  ORF type:complete len:735 (-),score=185.10 TRINITY_DN12537_c1_g1_i1:108-2312(-)